jgi:hypothetical protein
MYDEPRQVTRRLGWGWQATWFVAGTLRRDGCFGSPLGTRVRHRAGQAEQSRIESCRTPQPADRATSTPPVHR